MFSLILTFADINFGQEFSSYEPRLQTPDHTSELKLFVHYLYLIHSRNLK